MSTYPAAHTRHCHPCAVSWRTDPGRVTRCWLCGQPGDTNRPRGWPPGIRTAQMIRLEYEPGELAEFDGKDFP